MTAGFQRSGFQGGGKAFSFFFFFLWQEKHWQITGERLIDVEREKTHFMHQTWSTFAQKISVTVLKGEQRASSRSGDENITVAELLAHTQKNPKIYIIFLRCDSLGTAATHRSLHLFLRKRGFYIWEVARVFHIWTVEMRHAWQRRSLLSCLNKYFNAKAFPP